MLVETIGERQVIAHASEQVHAAVRPGMMLAEARAYCADLIHLPAMPGQDQRALEALARWLTRFSPSVSPNPPDSIFLDATGLERLYGGLATVRQLVADALQTLHIDAGVAIAPTPGAAWALAKFGAADTCIAPDREAVLRAIAPLPPQALRLDRDAAVMLGALGVDTIAALLRLRRDDVLIRLGAPVLRRIDQLTGDVFEPITFLEHHTPVRAMIEFDGVVVSLETIHLALRQLVAEIAAELACRGRGARELRVTLPRPYAPVIERTVRLSRPTRVATKLFELIRCALETTCSESSEGFLGIRLFASATERLVEEQTVLLGDQDERAAVEVDHLVERLQARFTACVEWPALIESRLPERAYRSAVAPLAAAAAVRPRRASRPLRLLREPQEIRVIVMPSESRDGLPVSMTRGGRVYRLPRARGPERIIGEWWDGRCKTRDYFDAEDEAGCRYWLFRVVETSRWFLHGMFE